MKETLLTNSEREFVLQAISEKKRVDGRQTYNFRDLNIAFGIDRGCCQVFLGKTRVLAQVSSEITMPKAARPVEGILFINLELSPMAAPHFEAGRLSSLGVELNRLLEKCLKDSRCLDLDSLCIVAGEKVWCIRVDVHVLNHDGNLADSAIIAAVSALAHYRRPEVTVTSEGIIVHPVEEKEPVPLGIYHMPLCISFAFFSEGEYMLLDPTELEERVVDGKMVLGMNVYREICTLHISGKMLLHKDQVMTCADIASKRVADIVTEIKEAVSQDENKRLKGQAKGFSDLIGIENILRSKLISLQEPVAKLTPCSTIDEEMTTSKPDEEMTTSKPDEEMTTSKPDEEMTTSKVVSLGPGTAKMGEDEWLKWDSYTDPDNST